MRRSLLVWMTLIGVALAGPVAFADPSDRRDARQDARRVRPPDGGYIHQRLHRRAPPDREL